MRIEPASTIWDRSAGYCIQSVIHCASDKGKSGTQAVTKRDAFPDDFWGGAGSVGGALDLEAADGMLGFGWHKVAGFGCGVPVAGKMELAGMWGMNCRDLTSAVFRRSGRDPPEGVAGDDRQDVVKTVSAIWNLGRSTGSGRGFEALGRAPERPQKFDGIEELPQRSVVVDADAEVVKGLIRAVAG